MNPEDTFSRHDREVYETLLAITQRLKLSGWKIHPELELRPRRWVHQSSGLVLLPDARGCDCKHFTITDEESNPIRNVYSTERSRHNVVEDICRQIEDVVNEWQFQRMADRMDSK